MWTHEYVGETDATPEAVWRVLRDLDNWDRWDTSMEKVELSGPFEVGSQVSMTPTGQEPIVSTIIGIRENEYYADLTHFAGLELRFSHTLERLANGGTRVLHRLEIDGAGGEEVGPQITEDFPDAMAALLAYAAKG